MKEKSSELLQYTFRCEELLQEIAVLLDFVVSGLAIRRMTPR